MSKCPPDMTDITSQTPLLWAVTRLHHGVVQLLLEPEDVNPNIANKFSQTPLLWAERGDDRVVDLLLEREDITPDIQDKYGYTPFALATRLGHVE